MLRRAGKVRKKWHLWGEKKGNKIFYLHKNLKSNGEMEKAKLKISGFIPSGSGSFFFFFFFFFFVLFFFFFFFFCAFFLC